MLLYILISLLLLLSFFLFSRYWEIKRRDAQNMAELAVQKAGNYDISKTYIKLPTCTRHTSSHQPQQIRTPQSIPLITSKSGPVDPLSARPNT